MESRVVNDEFQNRFGIASDKAINYIEKFFTNYIEKFKQVNKYDRSIYYGVKYEINNASIEIGGARGCLELKIIIEEKEYNLFEYFIVKEKTIVVNESNLDIIFKLLLEFLKEMKVI